MDELQARYGEAALFLEDMYLRLISCIRRFLLQILDIVQRGNQDNPRVHIVFILQIYHRNIDDQRWLGEDWDMYLRLISCIRWFLLQILDIVQRGNQDNPRVHIVFILQIYHRNIDDQRWLGEDWVTDEL